MSKFSHLENQAIVVETVLSECMTDAIVLEGLIDTVKKAGKDFWRKICELIEALMKKINDWRKKRKDAERAKNNAEFRKEQEQELAENRKKYRFIDVEFYFLYDAKLTGRLLLLLETINQQVLKYTSSSKQSLTPEKREEAQSYIQERLNDLKEMNADYDSLEKVNFDTSDATKVKAGRSIPSSIISRCESILDELHNKILSVRSTFDYSGRTIHVKLTEEEIAHNDFLKETLTTYVTMINTIIEKVKHDAEEMDRVTARCIELHYEF